MTRKERLTMARAAADLASAIRSGDVAAIDRSQRELGRVELGARGHARFPHR